MRNAKTQALTLGTGFLAVVLPVVFALAGPASAQDTLTNGAGTVTLTAPCSEGSSFPYNCDYTPASGTPYASGQQIDISGAANSAMAGAGTYYFEECSDLDGTTANLPTTPTNNCDGVTASSTTSVNGDGSFPAFNYTIYALPDNPTYHESSTHLPICGVYPNDCVVFIGEALPASGGLTEPHEFSAPFQVQADAGDAASDPGDGTPEVPLAIGLPLLAAAIGGGTLYFRRRRQAQAS